MGATLRKQSDRDVIRTDSDIRLEVCISPDTHKVCIMVCFPDGEPAFELDPDDIPSVIEGLQLAEKQSILWKTE